LGMNYWYNLLL